MNLKGKSVLLTGAAQRIGAVIARELARCGARVALHHHTSSRAVHDLAEELRREGAEVAAYQADLSEFVQCERLVTAILAELGGVDVLINNAAVYHRSPVGQTSNKDWDHCLRVNLTAPFALSRGVAPLMRARGSGVIINIADIAGERGWPNHAAYSCSQAGLLVLTRLLAVELAPEVRVNAVAPGLILRAQGMSEGRFSRLETRVPLGRAGTPEDVAEAVRILIQQDYITGEVLRVDGGRGARP